MLKEVLKSIILSQQAWLREEDREILREQLSDFASLSLFGYILTGVRRSGKSTLMKQIIRQQGSVNYFNFEDSRTAGFDLHYFSDFEELFYELTKRYSIGYFLMKSKILRDGNDMSGMRLTGKKQWSLPVQMPGY